MCGGRIEITRKGQGLYSRKIGKVKATPRLVLCTYTVVILTDDEHWLAVQ